MMKMPSDVLYWAHFSFSPAPTLAYTAQPSEASGSMGVWAGLLGGSV